MIQGFGISQCILILDFLIVDHFLDGQFDSPELPGIVGLVVDAGANCGYSALWFAWKYPSTKVYALEPDPGNFEILEKNSELYGERIIPMRVALWPEDREVYISDTGFRGGGELGLSGEGTNRRAFFIGCWNFPGTIDRGNLGRAD